MFFWGYHCTGCSRLMRRGESIEIDGPLGPERLCPLCGSAVVLAANRWLVALYAMVVAALSVTYGCWFAYRN